MADKPVKYVITHPKGHVYVTNRIDNLVYAYGFDADGLTKLGWDIKPIYANEVKDG